VSRRRARPADHTMDPAIPWSMRLTAKRTMVRLNASMTVAPSMRVRPAKRRELRFDI